MASFGEDFRKEALANPGRAVFRDVCGWRFGLSFGLQNPTREDFEWVKSGKGSAFSQSATRFVRAMTYEEYQERVAVERAVMEARGITNRTWVFSASLQPRGRSSTDKDWHYLGQMVAAVGAPIEACKTPLETTHPNDVHYWEWEEPEEKHQTDSGPLE